MLQGLNTIIIVNIIPIVWLRKPQIQSFTNKLNVFIYKSRIYNELSESSRTTDLVFGLNYLGMKRLSDTYVFGNSRSNREDGMR